MASQENLKEILADELALLDRSMIMLEHSFRKCKKVGIKNEYDLDEYEKFEAMNSRFSRSSDILIQKLLRLVDVLDLETPGTIKDRIYRAAKKGAIPNADIIIDIRNLRNSITHEYLPEAVKEIFATVLTSIPDLFNASKTLKHYCYEKYAVDL
ncbi:MAG: hypothetical protein WD491_14995 [Balneolales bacterium]